MDNHFASKAKYRRKRKTIFLKSEINFHNQKVYFERKKIVYARSMDMSFSSMIKCTKELKIIKKFKLLNYFGNQIIILTMNMNFHIENSKYFYFTTFLLI